MSNLDLFNRDLSMIIDGSIISYIRDRLAFSCETLSLGQYLSYFNGAFREFGFCNFLNVGTYTIRVAYLGYLDPICMVYIMLVQVLLLILMANSLNFVV